MSKKMILKLKEVRLNRKREIYKRIAHLEMGRNSHKERVIEYADAAQKEDSIRLLDLLVERGNEEVREINIALEKIAAGNYGNCEICEKRIETKRLKALPATRVCHKCAQNLEHAQELRKHRRDEIMDDALLDEYRDLLEGGILKGIAQFPVDTKSSYHTPDKRKKRPDSSG